MKKDPFRPLNSIPPVRKLRLVLVLTAGEGQDLVSLEERAVIVSGNDIRVGNDIPKVYVGEEEEHAARRLAGMDGEGWPGWEIIFPWLEQEVANA